MQVYGVDAAVRIASHLAFTYLFFWSLQSFRTDSLFKKNHQSQIRMFYVLFSFAIGYLISSCFLEILSLFRHLIL